MISLFYITYLVCVSLSIKQSVLHPIKSFPERSNQQAAIPNEQDTEFESGFECAHGSQLQNVGPIETPHDCALMVQETDECTSTLFMWSSSYPVWGCRCCNYDHNPIAHNLWTLYYTEGYEIKIQRSKSVGTGNDRHHLHIREIKAYDDGDNECELHYKDASPLMKIGNRWPDNVNDPNSEHKTPEKCIDGDLGTMNHNDYGTDDNGAAVPYGQEDHWMTFQCFCKTVARIDVYNRNDKEKYSKRLSGSVLSVTRYSDDVCKDHTILESEAIANMADEGVTFGWQPDWS